jgi:hypothetical protein
VAAVQHSCVAVGVAPVEQLCSSFVAYVCGRISANIDKVGAVQQLCSTAV